MSTTTDHQSPTGEPPPAPADHRSTVRRRWSWIVGGLLAAATFGVWIYAIFLYDPGLLTDELADKSFPRAAEKVCAASVAKVDALPRAEETKDPVQRADVVDTADAVLGEMVAHLQRIAPASPPAAKEAVNEWLHDWGTHLRDRAAYARELRVDRDARFKETTKGTRQISLAIDGFAEVNRMNSCVTTGDVG